MCVKYVVVMGITATPAMMMLSLICFISQYIDFFLQQKTQRLYLPLPNLGEIEKGSTQEDSLNQDNKAQVW